MIYRVLREDIQPNNNNQNQNNNSSNNIVQPTTQQNNTVDRNMTKKGNLKNPNKHIDPAPSMPA